MGKRSNFKRSPRDFYPTPEAAVLPLLPHLPELYSFWEPCAGDGALVGHLRNHTYVSYHEATDIKPQNMSVTKADALGDHPSHRTSVDFIITNPPWTISILHPMIVKFSAIAPTWLLFYADWMHTKQSAEFMPLCQKIVSVGRVKWIPDSKMTGKDNCAWYLFDKSHSGITQFFGR